MDRRGCVLGPLKHGLMNYGPGKISPCIYLFIYLLIYLLTAEPTDTPKGADQQRTKQKDMEEMALFSHGFFLYTVGLNNVNSNLDIFDFWFVYFYFDKCANVWPH